MSNSVEYIDLCVNRSETIDMLVPNRASVINLRARHFPHIESAMIINGVYIGAPLVNGNTIRYINGYLERMIGVRGTASVQRVRYSDTLHDSSLLFDGLCDAQRVYQPTINNGLSLYCSAEISTVSVHGDAECALGVDGYAYIDKISISGNVSGDISIDGLVEINHSCVCADVNGSFGIGGIAEV